MRLRAERAGGTMASTNKRVPVGKLGIANKVDRWRKLAALDDAVFEKRVAYFQGNCRQACAPRATATSRLVPSS